MDLAEMRLSTRGKADEESSGFIGNTTLDRFINQGCRWVYNKLATREGSALWREGTVGNGGRFDTVDSQAGYDLPATDMKIVLVQARPSSSSDEDDYRRVDMCNIADDGDAPLPPTSVRNSTFPYFRYYLAGGKIYLKKVPRDTFTIRLWDVPRFTKLSNETDVPGFEESYHELACELAALQCLGKSGEALFEERLKLFEIENMAFEDTLQHRSQQAEQMIITQRDYPRRGRRGF